MSGECGERQGASPAAFFSGATAARRGRSRVRRSLESALLGLARVGRALRPAPPYNVLRIELVGDLPEVEGEWARLTMRGFRRRPLSLLGLLAVLRTAREDPDLAMVLVEIHGLAVGWARLQSVRRALLDLRAAGKRVWVYLVQAGMREYYLGSAADRVLLAPATILEAAGIASEAVFLKGALEKIGIEAQLARAGRFKTAAEPLTRTEMSDEHRSMVNQLLDDLYEQLVGEIAAGRGLSPGEVRAGLEQGPLLAGEAQRRRLVDALGYPDEVRLELEERFGDPATIDLGAYLRRRSLAMRRAALDATRVGLLAVDGPIVLGDAGAGIAAGRSASWHGFHRELTAMAHDPRLAAIVLRIDSPGGSGLASDLMWRDIMQARIHKPVMVSMGDVAASGGYYLAAAADHVTAEAATLTGSIGVLAGKPVLRDLYEKLGITKEVIARGNAARESDYVRLDEAELARLREEADAFYAEFLPKVAGGRSLTREAVEAVAEGRVWTGRQAQERRLVDEVGGVEQSLAEVRRRLGLPAAARVALERRPRRRPFWQMASEWNLSAEIQCGLIALLQPLLGGERVLAVGPLLLQSPVGSEWRARAGGVAALFRPSSVIRLRSPRRPAPLVF